MSGAGAGCPVPESRVPTPTQASRAVLSLKPCITALVISGLLA